MAPSPRANDDSSAHTTSAARTSRTLRETALFVLAWSLLDICVNLRYPGGEARFVFLLPSFDVAILLSILAVLAFRRIAVPRAARIGLVVFFLSARALRLGDGFQDRYFHRPFNLFVDLPLLPELVRLFRDTATPFEFLATIFFFVLLVGACCAAIYWALCYSELYLRSSRHRAVLAAGLALFIVVSPIVPDTKYYRLWGAFAPSITPRFFEETDFLLHVYGYRKEKLREIEAVQRRLESTPHDLKALNAANVYLFVVESYGHTVFGNPHFFARMTPIYSSFEKALEAHGFSAASAFMTSPTYGGKSWLAHATLATGVRTSDQFHYALLLASKPKPIARFFKDAGYRTVSVLPGTRRKWSEGEAYQFEQKYYLSSFDYAGPDLGWGRLPDQYVIDFVSRREKGNRGRPLFIEYVLVSSHAPWAVLPKVVEDWNTIGRGEVYHRLPPTRFDTSYEHLEAAGDAYLSSIAYDLTVLEAFVSRFVTDDSLVIILGDHQPVPDVTGENQPWAVPVHVMSRNSRLTERFIARGYTSGMMPENTRPYPGLETFLPRFLEDFSSPSQAGAKR